MTSATSRRSVTKCWKSRWPPRRESCGVGLPRGALILVIKMSNSGEDHYDPVFVRRFDRFFVLNRPTGLNDRPYSEFRGLVDVVAEREERIRGECGSFDREPETLGTHAGDPE